MKQRKPGDYVVNAELTDEQRERFVQDCLNSGAEDEGDIWDPDYPITALGALGLIGGVDENYSINPGVQDVTHEYKDNPMTQADLMEQIAAAMRRNPDGWWREFEHFDRGAVWSLCRSSRDALLPLTDGRLVRPKPRTYTLHIEDMPEPEYYEIEKDGQAVTVNFDFGGHESAQQAMDKLKQAMGMRDD